MGCLRSPQSLPGRHGHQAQAQGFKNFFEIHINEDSHNLDLLKGRASSATKKKTKKKTGPAVKSCDGKLD